MLSWTERVMLHNQFRILELLDPAKAEEYQQKQEIVGKGYEALYATLNENVAGEPAPKSVSEEVHEIFELFRALNNSARKIDNVDASPPVMFQGFDGTHEPNHYAYAIFVIEKQGLWKEHRANSYNSGAPMLPKYARMIQAWSKHGRSGELDRNQIEDISRA
jgi:uncharacterized protein YfbU (UPF0304 family)